MKNNRPAFALANSIIVASAAIMFTATSMSAAILGDASSYAILGGSGVTFASEANYVTGYVGSYPTDTITGSETVAGISIDNTNASAARTSLLSAISYLNTLTITNIDYITTGALTTGTLYAGVYDLGSSASITGTITLDAGGSNNAIFVFIIDSTLTTAASSLVTITNGSASVYWVVGSSATLGSYSTLVGNVLAVESIGIGTYATLYGRALAESAVTLDGSSTVDNSDALDGLTIVPEPSAYALIGSSLMLGFAAMRRKSARRKIA